MLRNELYLWSCFSFLFFKYPKIQMRRKPLILFQRRRTSNTLYSGLCKIARLVTRWFSTSPAMAYANQISRMMSLMVTMKLYAPLILGQKEWYLITISILPLLGPLLGVSRFMLLLMLATVELFLIYPMFTIPKGKYVYIYICLCSVCMCFYYSCRENFLLFM